MDRLPRFAKRCDLRGDGADRVPIVRSKTTLHAKSNWPHCCPDKKMAITCFPPCHTWRNDHPIQICWKWNIGFWFCNAVSSYIVRFPPEKTCEETLIDIHQSIIPTTLELVLIGLHRKAGHVPRILSLHNWLCQQHARASRWNHFSKLWLQISKTVRRSPLHQESCTNACFPWLSTCRKYDLYGHTASYVFHSHVKSVAAGR